MAVSSGPKSHTFTVISVILAVFAPKPKMALKTLERSIVAQCETPQQTAHLCLTDQTPLFENSCVARESNGWLPNLNEADLV